MAVTTISARARNYVRTKVQDHMISTITLYRYGTVTFDSVSGISIIPDRAPLYVGKARIANINEGNVILVGEADISTLTTNISIPWTAPLPHRDDVVVVSACPNDTSLVGMGFRVMNISGGGFIGGARTMNCVSLADSAQWSK